MGNVSDHGRDRIASRRVDKFGQRREQLAASALLTLSELGYAQTSLREIAQNSEFSHGILHYYFRDKMELISYCVKQYRAKHVFRYQGLVAAASTADELKLGFGAAVAETLREDGPGHRLWYDLRNQSLFEEAFRIDVLEMEESLKQAIWRIVSGYATLARKSVTLPQDVAYALFDGLIYQGFLRQTAGVDTAAAELRSHTELLLDHVVR